VHFWTHFSGGGVGGEAAAGMSAHFPFSDVLFFFWPKDTTWW